MECLELDVQRRAIVRVDHVINLLEGVQTMLCVQLHGLEKTVKVSIIIVR